MKLGGYKVEQDSEKDLALSSNTHKLSAQNIIKESNMILDLRPFCSKVENQGLVGSCVGNAVVSLLEFLQIRDTGSHKDLSRLFIYYNSRLAHKEESVDGGTYVRTAMKTLSTLGTCQESTWKYDPSKVNTRPSWKSYREAFTNKIHGYYKLSSNPRDREVEIIQCLKSNHPVVFGMIVDDEYQSYSSGVVAMPKANRIGAGSHAQLIVGYNLKDKTWLVRNSWGAHWGEGGYAHVPFDYLLASKASDFWTATVGVK